MGAPTCAPPPPSPIGTLQALHLEDDIEGHAGLNCEPFDEAIMFAEGVNAPTVPLLYVYDPEGTSGEYDCGEEFVDDPDGTGNWRLVELQGSVAPSAGPVAQASFSAQLNPANGKHYLAFMHSYGLKCLAYYHDPSPDAATAFGYANSYWPLPTPNGVSMSSPGMGAPTCA